MIQDELNVKRVRLLDAATEAVSHTLKPLPKQLARNTAVHFGPSEVDPCLQFRGCGSNAP